MTATSTIALTPADGQAYAAGMTRGREVTWRSAPGREWWVATGAPAAALRPYVRQYQGYYERAGGVAVRRHEPSIGVPMIFEMSADMRLSTSVRTQAALTGHRSFVAGPSDGWAHSETHGTAHGIQVDLTPIGAYLFLGVPLDSLMNQAVEIDDILGSEGRALVESLHQPTNALAFDAADRAIAARIARAKPASRPVVWAWQRIVESGGTVHIGALAERIGWSRKHLIARFREQIGLPPKTYARIVRFNRAVRMLDGLTTPRWAEIAASCGYYDQAHLIRDFAQFAGATPTDYIARRLPGGGVDGS